MNDTPRPDAAPQAPFDPIHDELLKVHLALVILDSVLAVGMYFLFPVKPSVVGQALSTGFVALGLVLSLLAFIVFVFSIIMSIRSIRRHYDRPFLVLPIVSVVLPIITMLATIIFGFIITTKIVPQFETSLATVIQAGLTLVAAVYTIMRLYQKKSLTSH